MIVVLIPLYVIRFLVHSLKSLMFPGLVEDNQKYLWLQTSEWNDERKSPAE
jgi:hypothetical protein